MLAILTEALLDILEESVILIPLLFLTYLAMECLERKTRGKTGDMMKKAGPLGPAVGALVGAIPQCGFSAAAANLYAGRIITMGTLLAVFLSTSDEMLPMLISAKLSPILIAKILLGKVAVGIVAGLLVDLILRRKYKPKMRQARIQTFCQQQRCQCANGVMKSALRHTIKIGGFIIGIGFLLNVIMGIIGEEALASLVRSNVILGPIVAGLIGLIPNCAASVAITQLYIEGIIGIGTLFAGLLVGAGVGLLVLFRVNKNRAENLRILGILYGIGVFVGIVLELL